jgi:GTP cyclohydrolase II
MEANLINAKFGPGRLVRLVSRAKLPSRFGQFEVVAFECTDGREHIAMVRGDVSGKSKVQVRIHSECLTGDVMGSLRCDCRDQLESAMERLGAAECGVLLYMRQEGRGIGLANKIRAYALQEQGLDTVEANIHLGFDDDERSYDAAAQMLQELELESVVLITNNPKKIEGIRKHGVDVEGRISATVAPTDHNAHYLNTKRKKSGHLL